MKPHDVHPSVAARLGHTTDVPFVERDRLGRPGVLHRPYQIVSLHDLAGRLVIAGAWC